MVSKITCPQLEKNESISHAFFTREGGVSEGIYTSLNCGPLSDDNSDAVTENRTQAMAAIDHTLEQLCTAWQCHTNEVVVIEDASIHDPQIKVDALVTQTPGVVVGVLTADCAPVLLADPQARVVAAAHAGWKGALSGIVENTIATMENLGATRENIIVSIGPHISQESYEVGEEFKHPFLEQSEENAQFFAQGKDTLHYHFDLGSYILHRLQLAGIQHTQDLQLDTYSDETHFFSYRRSCHRSEPDYGRLLSAISLK